MQAAPGPQMTRIQKLRWYADQLIKDAEGEEKTDKETAISHYLQAAEILLLLSKTEENYPVWRAYTDKASHCQQRVRILIASTPKVESGSV